MIRGLKWKNWCGCALLLLLYIAPGVSGGVVQNTTVDITNQSITSTTTLEYTGNASILLLARIDEDNNSFVSAWEVVRYDVQKRKELLREDKYPFTLENATQVPQVDVSTSFNAIGNTSSPRRVTMRITLGLHLQGFPLRLNITAPDNHTLVIVHAPLRIEGNPGLEVKTLRDRLQLAPPKGVTVMLALNLSQTQEEARDPILEEEENSTLFILFLLFFSLIMLLILVYRVLMRSF